MIEPDGHDRVLRRLIEETRQLHAREATRVFTRSVLSASGHDPRDDATVLCLDWPRPD